MGRRPSGSTPTAPRLRCSGPRSGRAYRGRRWVRPLVVIRVYYRSAQRRAWLRARRGQQVSCDRSFKGCRGRFCQGQDDAALLAFFDAPTGTDHYSYWYGPGATSRQGGLPDRLQGSRRMSSRSRAPLQFRSSLDTDPGGTTSISLPPQLEGLPAHGGIISTLGRTPIRWEAPQPQLAADAARDLHGQGSPPPERRPAVWLAEFGLSTAVGRPPG